MPASLKKRRSFYSESGYGTEPPGSPSSFGSALGKEPDLETDDRQDEEEYEPTTDAYAFDFHALLELEDGHVPLGLELEQYMESLSDRLSQHQHPMPPNFFRSPDALEHRVYTQAIERANSDVQILDEDIFRLEMILADLEARKGETIERRKEYKAFLSIIRSLPYDVLYAVFVEYVLHLSGNPWVLTSVCRLWRKCALEAKMIWTKILIDTAYRSRHRNKDGREVCRTVTELESYLQRSGTAPLDITILNSNDAALTVGLSMVRERWETIVYYDNLEVTVSNILFGAKVHGNSRPGGYMNELVIRGGGWRGATPEDGKPVSELIKWVELAQPYSLKFLDHYLHHYSNNPWWSHLHCLHIHLPRYHLESEKSRSEHKSAHYVVLCILTIAQRNLTELSLMDIQFKPEHFLRKTSSINKRTGLYEQVETCSPWEFQKVEDLTLRRVKMWWNIRAKTVTKLTLEPPDQAVPTILKLVLPELTSLHYIPDENWVYHGFIEAPKLEILTLNGTKGTAGRDSKVIWMGKEDQVVLNPVVLHLNHITTEWWFLSRALQPLSSLVELHFHAAAPAQSFFRNLFVKKQRTRGLPALKVLKINMGIGAGMAHATAKLKYTIVFQQVAAARTGKFKLDVFEVTWGDKFGAEAGVTDFLKETIPEEKIKRKMRSVRLRTFGRSDDEEDEAAYESEPDSDSEPVIP